MIFIKAWLKVFALRLILTIVFFEFALIITSLMLVGAGIVRWIYYSDISLILVAIKIPLYSLFGILVIFAPLHLGFSALDVAAGTVTKGETEIVLKTGYIKKEDII